MNKKYHVYWECIYSGVGDTIGYYNTYQAAEQAYYSAIKENPHVHYHLRGGNEDKDYDPDHD